MTSLEAHFIPARESIIAANLRNLNLAGKTVVRVDPPTFDEEGIAEATRRYIESGTGSNAEAAANQMRSGRLLVWAAYNPANVIESRYNDTESIVAHNAFPLIAERLSQLEAQE